MAPKFDTIREIEHIWPLLSGIRVLVVMDGIAGSGHYASFGPGDQSTNPLSGGAYFGLSEFIHTLTTSTFPTIFVTKAHRDTDVRNAQDIANFRFDQHDLSVYDVIFLFGVAGVGETVAPMSDPELVALATFMDGGGGVFATGDHADLGVELNGRVPRVRSMRKWYFPNTGPLGEPVAPPPIGTARIETTQPGHNETFLHFDDQSDDIPQPLTLRWYSQNVNIFTARRYPHALLCGPNGPITVAPDHMHEGEVILPWDVDATLTFGGQHFVEYPTSPTGDRPLPEIVAWGKVLMETNTSTESAHIGDPTHIAQGRTFGVVGAYDGHRAGVGRVAVDSTWHHFFDINLIGDPIAPSPKTLGFNASSDGQKVLADIQAYFKNLVVWLARPNALKRVFASAALFTLRSQPLAMIVDGRTKYTFSDLTEIGDLALKNIYRLIPPCSALVLILPYFVAGPVRVFPPDPWAKVGPKDLSFVDPLIYLRTALGHAIAALAVERDRLFQADPEEAVARIVRVVEHGVATGMRGLGDELEHYAESIGRVAKGLKGSAAAQ